MRDGVEGGGKGWARSICEPSICAEASCSRDLVTLKANVDGRMVMGMTADGEAGACAGLVQAVHASSDADEGRTKQRGIWGRCQT